MSQLFNYRSSNAFIPFVVVFLLAGMPQLVSAATVGVLHNRALDYTAESVPATDGPIGASRVYDTLLTASEYMVNKEGADLELSNEVTIRIFSVFLDSGQFVLTRDKRLVLLPPEERVQALYSFLQRSSSVSEELSSTMADIISKNSGTHDVQGLMRSLNRDLRRKKWSEEDGVFVKIIIDVAHNSRAHWTSVEGGGGGAGGPVPARKFWRILGDIGSAILGGLAGAGVGAPGGIGIVTGAVVGAVIGGATVSSMI